jgi:hypothetical protein
VPGTVLLIIPTIQSIAAAASHYQVNSNYKEREREGERERERRYRRDKAGILNLI